MSITDLVGAITYANDKFCQISGYTRAELLGQTHRLINSGVQPKEFFDQLWHSILSGKVWHGEICNRSKSGALFWLQATIVPLLDARGLLKSQLQESDVQIEIDIPADPLLILGQSAQLEQAFVDLLQNAMEAMETSDERKIRIRVNEQNKWVRVSIADTGRGIRPDLLTRIFEPGFTTKVDKGISRGLGLGLYATHTIIQNHWGRIDVHSQVWQGSTFTVYLPAI